MKEWTCACWRPRFLEKGQTNGCGHVFMADAPECCPKCGCRDRRSLITRPVSGTPAAPLLSKMF